MGQVDRLTLQRTTCTGGQKVHGRSDAAGELLCWFGDRENSTVAKPNYAYQKRQRELAKKQKQEAKRQKQQGADQDAVPDPSVQSSPTQGTAEHTSN